MSPVFSPLVAVPRARRSHGSDSLTADVIGVMSGKVTLTSAPSVIEISGGKVMVRL